MNEYVMLQAVKADLGITTTAYDERLTARLRMARDFITTEGITLDCQRLDDRELVVMYAAWLWRSRDKQEPMPRMLRWNLNNRLMEEKGTLA